MTGFPNTPREAQITRRLYRNCGHDVSPICETGENQRNDAEISVTRFGWQAQKVTRFGDKNAMSSDQTDQIPRYWDVWLREDLSVWGVTPSQDAPTTLDDFIQTATCAANRGGWRGWVRAPDAVTAIEQGPLGAQAAQAPRSSLWLAQWSFTR